MPNLIVLYEMTAEHVRMPSSQHTQKSFSRTTRGHVPPDRRLLDVQAALVGVAGRGSRASCVLLGKFPEDRVHPGGGEPDVLEKPTPLIGWQRSLQVFAAFGGHVFLTQFAESLDEQAA